MRSAAGNSRPSVACSRDRCSAVCPSTSQGSTAGMTRMLAAYSATCPALFSSADRAKIAAPQATTGTPTTTMPTTATTRPASALRVARQVTGDHSAVSATGTRVPGAGPEVARLVSGRAGRAGGNA